MASLTWRKVVAGCWLGAYPELLAKGLYSPCELCHVAAWACLQHGSWILRRSIPNAYEGVEALLRSSLGSYTMTNLLHSIGQNKSQVHPIFKRRGHRQPIDEDVKNSWPFLTYHNTNKQPARMLLPCTFCSVRLPPMT